MCKRCDEFFEKYRCNKPLECDCPKCQNMCLDDDNHDVALRLTDTSLRYLELDGSMFRWEPGVRGGLECATMGANGEIAGEFGDVTALDPDVVPSLVEAGYLFSDKMVEFTGR